MPKSSLPIVPPSLNSGRAPDPSVSPESSFSSSSSSQSPQHLGLGLSNIIGRIYSTSRHPSQATRPIWPIEGPSETDSSNSNITQPGSGLPVTQREAGSPNQAVPETSSLSQLSRGSIYDLLPPYDATGYYESEHEPGRQFGGVKGQYPDQSVRQNLSNHVYTAYRNVPQTQIQDAGFGDNFPSQPTDIEDIVRSPRARFRSSDRRRPFRSPSPIPPPYRAGPV